MAIVSIQILLPNAQRQEFRSVCEMHRWQCFCISKSIHPSPILLDKNITEMELGMIESVRNLRL